MRRREELAAFLRRRRASIRPEDVGLPEGRRRRTPGLRREEVAQLAGVGITWYTWLEQGRDVRASLDVLEALSRALCLTAAERTHLIVLGRGGDVSPGVSPLAEEVSPSLRRLIENLGPGPAYIHGRRWDYLAWNRSTERVFCWEPGPDPLSRNDVWLTFMDPIRRKLSDDWHSSASLLVREFRAKRAKHPDDPAFEELFSTLQSASSEFRKLWNRPLIVGSSEGREEIIHPSVGRLVFERAAFHRGVRGEQRLIVYSPIDELDTPARLARLVRNESEAQPIARAG